MQDDFQRKRGRFGRAAKDNAGSAVVNVSQCDSLMISELSSASDQTCCLRHFGADLSPFSLLTLLLAHFPGSAASVKH